MHGTLTFTIARDLGDLGAAEGVPLTFEWSIWRNLAVGLPWLIVLLLLFRAANRNRQAWAILIPLALLEVPLVLAGIGISLLPDSFARMMGLVESLNVFVAAWAAVCLLSDRLTSRPYVNAFGMAVAILLMMLLVGAFGASGCGFDATLIGIVFTSGFVAGVFLLAMTLAGFRCRKAYTSGKFCFWAYAWASICVMVLIFGFVGLTAIPLFISTGEPAMALMMLTAAIIYGLIGCFVLCAVVTPFLMLTFMSPLYRQRFFAIFRLNGMEVGEVTVQTPMPEVVSSGGE